MKKILVIGAVAMLAVAAGCNNKKKDAAGSKALLVPPPQPMHPIAAAPVGTEPVTPVAYEPAPQPAGNGPAVGSTYTVQKGDTLWSIATRAYGNGQQFRKIVAANPSIKGERVNIGQKITIPQ